MADILKEIQNLVQKHDPCLAFHLDCFIDQAREQHSYVKLLESERQAGLIPLQEEANKEATILVREAYQLRARELETYKRRQEEFGQTVAKKNKRIKFLNDKIKRIREEHAQEIHDIYKPEGYGAVQAQKHFESLDFF